MIGGTVLLAFVGLAGVATAQTRFEVRGRVVDESDDAVQGVSIRVEAAGSDGPPPAQRFPNYTDEHGDFSLSLERGKYYIMASPIGGLDNQPEIHTDGSSGDPYGPGQRRRLQPIASRQQASDAKTPLLIRFRTQLAALASNVYVYILCRLAVGAQYAACDRAGRNHRQFETAPVLSREQSHGSARTEARVGKARTTN